MKTVHLSVFSFGRKTKFLCDHRNNGNRHSKVSKNQRTTHANMAQSAARESHNLQVVSSSLTGCSSRKTFSFAFSTNYEISNNKKRITSKIYHQPTRSEPNWLLLVQLKINPLKISDFSAKRG